MRDTRTQLDFLSALGLDATADAKAVRRAYARELKQIDLEREPGKFQALREAYEAALRWFEYQAHRQREAGGAASAAQPVPMERPAPASAPEPAPAPAPAPAVLAKSVATAISAADLPLLATPRELAQSAFAAFETACEALRTGRMVHDHALWKAELQLRLQGDQLLNMSARTIFEARIAHLIASGWKAGHGALYAAASEIFNWPNDLRRLMQFEYAGVRINAAIDQENLLGAQEGPTLGTQRRLLQSLQRGEVPMRRDVAQIAQLKTMLERFPDLLALTVDPEVIERWLRGPGAPGAKAVPTVHGPVVPMTAPEASHFDRKKGPSWFLFVFVLILLAAIGWSYVKTSNTQPWWGLASGAATRPTASIAQAYPAGRSLSQQELDEIASRIAFKPGPDAVPGKRFIEYKIRLDRKGTMLYMERLNASDDQAYIIAVGNAIRATHFAPDVQREFRIRFSGTVSKTATSAPAGHTGKRAGKRTGD